MASTLSLRPQPPLVHGRHCPPVKSSFLTILRARRSPISNPNPRPPSPRSLIAAALPSPDPSWEREEQRWLREEQRWLREESRWLREEARWSVERESLLREIAALRLRLETLERERTSLTTGGVLSAAAAGPRLALAEEADVKEIVLEEEVRVSGETVEEKKARKEKRVLMKGTEGEDVREMQEALLKLGFYSGEEDMEFSSFSSGTERAVKTWQSSLGTPEDGVMTAELLERLFMEQGVGSAIFEVNTGRGGDSVPVVLEDGTNGAAISSITEITEIQQTVVKEKGDAKVEVSEHRVFLLGENRWEEPSRLIGSNNTSGGSKATTAMKCLSCRGEGRLMCTECDGTGEPNIEPQFLEWVGEGTKCPYCDGLGHTICDICEGNGTVQT